MFKQLKAKGVALVAVPASFLMAANSYAADGWDYSAITTGINFASIATGVLAVAALLGGVYAGIKGARIVLGFLRS